MVSIMVPIDALSHVERALDETWRFLCFVPTRAAAAVARDRSPDAATTSEFSDSAGDNKLVSFIKFALRGVCVRLCPRAKSDANDTAKATFKKRPTCFECKSSLACRGCSRDGT